MFELMLPRLKRQVGKKLLIGDNLSSHISMAVIDSCKKNNIEFVCLPPNSTHKLQPLDVGVFAPLKKTWREVLTAHKLKHPKAASIDKSDFPQLMKTLLEKANPGRHLPKAFAECGLHPVSKEAAFKNIPHRAMVMDDDEVDQLMRSTLGEKLEELRGVSGGEKRRPRGKKVEPGKSYTADTDDDSEDSEGGEEDEDGEAGAESKDSEVDDVDADVEVPSCVVKKNSCFNFL